MNHSPSQVAIAVIGGGITGLAAAFTLQRLDPTLPVTVLERERRIGGKILTERRDGFVVEGGPDSFLAAKPAGVELCRALGMEDRLEGPNPAARGAFVLSGGALTRIPEGLTGLVPGRLSPLFRSNLLSPLGRARVALDLILPADSHSDESLAAFITRRLGREAYERLVEPLMAGIYAGDGSHLSLAATFPQLQQAERDHGSLIRGARRNSPPTGRPGFLTPVGGMAEIVEALHSALGSSIWTATGAASVERGQDTWTIRLDSGGTVRAGAVIVATPAPAAANLLAPVDADLGRTLAEIPHASTATLSLAYRNQDVPYPLTGTGYLIPRREGRVLLACTWTSSKFARRAPAGHALFRLFVGRAGIDDVVQLPEEMLVALARDEVRATMDITAEPLFARLFRWPRAMPQYTLGHLERTAHIRRAAATINGLEVAGNYLGGVGIPDCIACGKAAAQSALAYVRNQRQNAIDTQRSPQSRL